jgi:integrase
MKIQQGYVTEKSGAWLGHYSKWVVNPATGIKRRKQLAEKLGPVSGMTRTKAKEALRKLIVKELGLTGDSRITVSGFVQSRWKPLREGDWRESTKATNEELIKIVTDRFGNEALEDIDNVAMQTWLNSIAKTRSGSAVRHCRIFLRSIFAEAVEQNYIDKSPARLLKVPKKLRAVQRPYLTLAEVKALIKASMPFAGINDSPGIRTRDTCLLRLALMTALRPGELFALKWKCIDLAKGTLSIYETVYRGKLRPYGKTTEEGTVERLVIPEEAIEALREQLALAQDSGKGEQDDFVFPSESGTFWWKENYQRRVLTPLGKAAGIPRINFQILRRTTATHMQHLGSLKDIQTVLRHKKAETTANNYVQAISSTVREASEKWAGLMSQQ